MSLNPKHVSCNYQCKTVYPFKTVQGISNMTTVYYEGVKIMSYYKSIAGQTTQLLRIKPVLIVILYLN